MRSIAFIPLRKGSKSISRKNIKLFCEKPLVYWNLSQLQESNINDIIVATDCDDTKSIVESFNLSKVQVYDRSPENAKDNSLTESVMLEYINSVSLLDSDIFMLVQATSPFTQTKHFNEGLDLFQKYDSVLSCCVSKKFIWRPDGVPLNYDIYNRPRRQDFKGSLIENGAFYISSVENIKFTKNRISGDIGIYKMPEYTCIEIDDPHDWLAAEQIMYWHLQNSV